MSTRHIIKTNMALWFRAVEIDIALTEVPYLYDIARMLVYHARRHLME